MTRESISKKYKPEMENLILILTELQERNPQHYIDPEDMRWVAAYLNTSLGAVYGVVKYYTLFSTQPRGRHVIRVCRSPVCDMLDGRRVQESLEALLGIGQGEVTPDGLFSWEAVECLGHCDQAPVMMVDDTVYGGLTHGKVQAVIASLQNNPPKDD